MKIQPEEPGRLKITLTEKELAGYGLTYEQLDYDRPETRKVINTLIQAASVQTGFSFSSGRLLVEVFSAPSGGCTIYFTLLDSRSEKRSQIKLKRIYPAGNPYTFEFATGSDMLAAVEQLYRREDSQNLKSYLYLLEGRYRLVLYPQPGDRYTPLLMGEYACSVCHTPALAAYTAEHGKILATGDAIRRIGHALCTG